MLDVVRINLTLTYHRGAKTNQMDCYHKGYREALKMKIIEQFYIKALTLKSNRVLTDGV